MLPGVHFLYNFIAVTDNKRIATERWKWFCVFPKQVRYVQTYVHPPVVNRPIAALLRTAAHVEGMKKCGNSRSTSVWGRTLYVRDIKTVVVPESVRILQFADDIMLQESHHCKNTVASNLSTAVSSLAQWLRQRGLILNERKSQVLWICNESTPAVCCNGFPLPEVSEAKYLGLTFDRGLTWKPHIANKAAAAARTIGALRRAKNSLSIEARWIYYSSIIMSNLLYGSNGFVSSLPVQGLSRLIKLQKKGLRAIFGLPFWAHSAPLFLRFNEDNVHDKMLKKLCVLVWRTQNNCCSNHIRDIFHARANSGLSTRGSSSQALVLPPINKLSGLRRPAFHGCLVWNALPAKARLCKNKKSFLQLLPQIMPIF